MVLEAAHCPVRYMLRPLYHTSFYWPYTADAAYLFVKVPMNL